MNAWQVSPKFGFDFEVRLDAPDGKLLGKGSLPVPQKGPMGAAHVPLTAVTDGKFHQLYFLYKPNPKGTDVAYVVMLQFNAK
jgi:cytochrome c